MVGAWWPEITKNRYLGAPRPEVGKIDIFSHPKKKHGKTMDIREKPEMEKQMIFSRKYPFFIHFSHFRHFPKISMFFPFLFWARWEIYIFHFLGIGKIS